MRRPAAHGHVCEIAQQFRPERPDVMARRESAAIGGLVGVVLSAFANTDTAMEAATTATKWLLGELWQKSRRKSLFLPATQRLTITMGLQITAVGHGHN